jgi:hypothetical protein
MVALEDHSAQVFIMESGDARTDWQVGIDLLYRCVRSDLVTLYPYGDGMEKLSLQAYFEQMARSNPDASITEDWNSARAWVGTYVVGTLKCVHLLASHGLLNEESALIQAKGLRQQVLTAPSTYTERSFVNAFQSVERAKALEHCAELSCAAEAAFSESERGRRFMIALEMIFEQHNVPLCDATLFPVNW